MDKGINFEELRNMTVGEVQKLEADYPNLFDLAEFLEAKKIDTMVDDVEMALTNGKGMGEFMGITKEQSAQDLVDLA